MVRRATRETPEWPTPAQVQAWRLEQKATAEARDRTARRAYQYRNEVYLNRGNLLVPSHGVTRRLQALFALGWTTIDMAERLGVTYARVSHLMRGKYPVLHRSTYAAVAALYDQLSMVTPVDQAPKGRGNVYVHARAARMAAARGYAPPLAWDDIDDPAEIPDTGAEPDPENDPLDPVVVDRILAGEKIEVPKERRAEIVNIARARGVSVNRVSVIQGWHYRDLKRDDNDQESA